MIPKKYLLTISVILIIMILSNCENDIVNNNISLPNPIIKSDTVLIENVNTVVFKAWLNTEILPVSYYYEYGDSASYEFQTENISIDSTNESYIEIIDTVTNILPNSAYHYRIVITNANGIYYSTDKVFSTRFYNPPLFLNFYADDITSIGARLVGSVDQNGNTITSVKFEYGLTKYYDKNTQVWNPTSQPVYRPTSLEYDAQYNNSLYQKTTQGIVWREDKIFNTASINNHVDYVQRITNLKYGAQYHYRLYLKTTRGDVWSEDKTFNTTSINNPVEFNYPFSVGTKWTYKYYLNYNSVPGTTPPSEVRNGVHTWKVVSVETNNDSMICNIVSNAIDTVYRRVQFGQPPDTTYENITTFFTIVVYQYIIIPNWYKSVRYGFGNMDPNLVNAFPRYIEEGTIDVALAGSIYENNIGLKNYDFHFGGNTQSITEYLNLLSFND